jgi:hypothetical protein
MPCSHPEQINEIVSVLLIIEPKALLDVGVGYGKYGFLAREFLDIASQSNKNYKDIKHTIKIDGIEIYEDYISQHHRIFYDNIYIGNANEVFEKTYKNYDLVLLIDVLEHFSREEGLRFITNLRRHVGNILISTPKVVQEQGEEFGNIYETHKYEWKRADYDEFPDKAFIKNNYSLICLIGKDAIRVESELASRTVMKRWIHKFNLVSIKILMAKYFPFLKTIYRTLKG